MAGGGSAYDDRVVRARLAQAFGRLIRRQGDCGVFVILSAAMPSRLLAAFPAGVPVSRVPLDEAIARVEEFLPGNGEVAVRRTDGGSPSTTELTLGELTFERGD
jgi:ATP-dependent DNA helicase DinG